jgi:hypothetical protein
MSNTSRRAVFVIAIAMAFGMLALPAMAQVDVGDTIAEYPDVGGVVIERPVDAAPVAPVRVDRGTPAAPAEVLGVQHRLAVTGSDLAVLVAFGALLLALGVIVVRSGRRVPAHR